MTRIIIFLTLLAVFAEVRSQAPEIISYQAVVRSPDGSVSANEPVSIQISVIQGAINGQVVYTEEQTIQSNQHGLVTLDVGAGDSSDDFSNIDWSQAPIFMEIIANGTNLGTNQLLSVPFAMYVKNSGNSFSGDYDDLAHIPGLAEVAMTGAYGDILGIPAQFDPVTHSHTENEITDLQHYSDTDLDGNETAFSGWDKAITDDFHGDMFGEKITNVADPASSKDVATKAYIDLLYSRIAFLEAEKRILKDLDGNIYTIIGIGNQVWMGENLRVTRYSDGTAIPLVESGSAWESLETGDRAYCWYNNSSVGNEHFGALYTWTAATNNISSSATPSGVQGVCPSGWHIPSDNEWKELEMFLGMTQQEADENNFRGTDEGGKLKSPVYWDTSPTGVTNESGFSALPSGFRRPTNEFLGESSALDLWTATQSDSNNGWRRYLSAESTRIHRGTGDKTYGFSVRCVQD